MKEEFKNNTFKLEYIAIPDNMKYMRMISSELDRFISERLCDDSIIYLYNGSRYVFFDDDFVIEEIINVNSKQY
jgi:hypothetical protein